MFIRVDDILGNKVILNMHWVLCIRKVCIDEHYTVFLNDGNNFQVSEGTFNILANNLNELD